MVQEGRLTTNGSPGDSGACSSRCRRVPGSGRWSPSLPAPTRCPKMGEGPGRTWLPGRVWGREALLRCWPTALPLPLLGDRIPPGCRAPGHIRSSVGTSWGSSAPSPCPPMGTRARPGPQGRGGGRGLLSLGPVREEGRAHWSRPTAGAQGLSLCAGEPLPLAAESGVRRMGCGNCCGHTPTCRLSCCLLPGHPVCSPQIWDPNFAPQQGAGKCPDRPLREV